MAQRRLRVFRARAHDHGHATLHSRGDDLEQSIAFGIGKLIDFAGHTGVHNCIRACGDGKLDHAPECGRVGRAVSTERRHEYRAYALDR